MKHRITGMLRRFGSDQRGGEVVEYVLILGIVIVVTITTVAGFGVKVLGRWTSVNNSM